MLEIVSALILLIAFLVCCALFLIDLRTRLLPNVLVLLLAFCGLTFHLCTLFHYEMFISMGIGAVIGGGCLLFTRAIGNYFYDTDTLGLGDVKLMAAGGLWLGIHDIALALIAGAAFGLVHGGVLIIHHFIKTKSWPMISQFSLPAGPGFILGLIGIALVKFWGLPHLFI